MYEFNLKETVKTNFFNQIFKGPASKTLPKFVELIKKEFISFWQGRRDSNSRPTVLETVALPTELHPFDLERVKESNPRNQAWKAGALPLSYTRKNKYTS